MIPYEWTSHADRQFRKLSPAAQRQITAKLAQVLAAPEPLRFAESMVGRKGEFRFRAGDYRIIGELRGGRFLLLAVGHRREVYR